MRTGGWSPTTPCARALFSHTASTSPRASARAIAHTIADRAAPLGVRAVLASAHLARTDGDAAAIDRLRPEMTRLFGSADGAEGVQSFIERREARFQGS